VAEFVGRLIVQHRTRIGVDDHGGVARPGVGGRDRRNRDGRDAEETADEIIVCSRAGAGECQAKLARRSPMPALRRQSPPFWGGFWTERRKTLAKVMSEPRPRTLR
jgi:hypothetical protein